MKENGVNTESKAAPQKGAASAVERVVIKPGDVFQEDTGEKWTAQDTADQHNIYATNETGCVGIFCAVEGCDMHENIRVL